MSEGIAHRLAYAHPPDYVQAKCELVDWLVETKDRAVGRNAAGYLRRAIEEDYQPPRGYRSRAAREAEAEARAAAREAEEELLREQAEEDLRARELDIAAAAAIYPPQAISGTALTTQQAWDRATAQLAEVLSRPNFEMFLRHTLLLSCEGDEAEIGARSAFEVDYLATRLDHHITNALTDVLGRPVRCHYASLAKLLREQPPAAPREPRGDAAPPIASVGRSV